MEAEFCSSAVICSTFGIESSFSTHSIYSSSHVSSFQRGAESTLISTRFTHCWYLDDVKAGPSAVVALA